MSLHEELAKLEAYCEAFYGGSYAEQRQAHSILLPLVSDPSYVLQFQMILANSHAPPALIFAASALMKLFSGHWNRIQDIQKDDTRKFLLNYLYNNGAALLRNPTLLQNLVRLLCRIIKLGWLENLEYQNVTEQVSQYLQASTSQFIVGLIIYTLLTEDMRPQGGSRLARFRRTAVSFRETALGDIFQTAIQTLQQLHNNALPLESPEEGRMFLKQVLNLCLNCLSFDFAGSLTDESNDEQATIMIPNDWHILREEKIPSILFAMYHHCWSNVPPREDCAKLCLQCLVLLAAIRSSFFHKDEEKRAHITQLIEGTASIVEQKIGLHDDQCYHEFCRLLGRINASHQLAELSQFPTFLVWLDDVYQFTIESLENWTYSPNSKHYLVWVWGNLVAPTMYLRDKIPPNLSQCISKVSIAFLKSRLKIAEAVAEAAENDVETDFENPLANEIMRAEQLEVIATLGKCGYHDICRPIIDLLTEAQNQARTKAISPILFQEKATWLVYIIATLINLQVEQRTGITTLLSIDSAATLVGSEIKNDTEDASRPYKTTEDLISAVLLLMKETDQLSQSPASLELAYLYFLEHFRKVVISEHAKSLIHLQGTEPSLKILNCSDPESLTNLIMEKIFFNLQARTESEVVVKRTVQIFSDSVMGLSVVHAPTRMPQFIVCGKLVLTSPLVQEALRDHQNPRFSFLSNPAYGRHRTTYYATLTKLLLLDVKEDTTQQQWEAFMEPFERSIATLRECRSDASPAVRQLIITLCRDLRGIASALTSTDGYTLLFDWLVNNPKYPGSSRVDAIIQSVEFHYSDPAVMIPVLRFMAEFACNRSQRIVFGANSPNGIYLFKVISTLIHEYGRRMMACTSFEDVYRGKYKGVAGCLELISNTLSGGYTNFGVFKVYNDTVLRDTILLCLEMCLSVPAEDLQAYMKTFKSYYSFLELATSLFMDLVITLKSESLAHLCRSLEDGLCSYENGTAMQSCTTIGAIVQFIHTHRSNVNTEEGMAVNRFLTEQPNSLKRILQLILQLLLTGEATSAWSTASPLLGLILLHEESFVQIKQQLILHQIPERRATLDGYFNDLMIGIDNTLSQQNKTNFSKNLYVFAQLMRSLFA